MISYLSPGTVSSHGIMRDSFNGGGKVGFRHETRGARPLKRELGVVWQLNRSYRDRDRSTALRLASTASPRALRCSCFLAKAIKAFSTSRNAASFARPLRFANVLPRWL